jgi:hypothetical protein
MIVRKKVTESEILVCGTVRNLEKKIKQEIAHFKKITKIFKKVNFFLVESDSEDNTCNILKCIKKKESNFRFLSLGNLEAEIPLRTERLAFCRNIIVDEVIKNYESVDYIFMADLDGVNNLLTEKNIIDCWQASVDWDVICANQLSFYYDIYALRQDFWNNNDCVITKNKLESIIGINNAHKVAIESKQIKINPDMQPFKVNSAFGGFAIYKSKVFVTGRYNGLYDNNEICEHVKFNEIITNNGYSIYINPALINCIKPASINQNKINVILIKYLAKILRILLGKYRLNSILDIIRYND